MDEKPVYTQDQVNEILKRALAQDVGDEHRLSHAELVEIAEEAGIDRDALDRAMVDLAQEHSREAARQHAADEIRAERFVQLKRFGASAVSYGMLNGVLYFINAHLVGGDWLAWPLAVCGGLLALQARHVLFPYDKVQKRRKQMAREREQERRRAEREAWKKKVFGDRRVENAGKAFEAAVQAGVSLLLDIAERKLNEHRGRTDPKDPRR